MTLTVADAKAAKIKTAAPPPAAAETNPLPELPALRAAPVSLLPVVVADTREKLPLPMKRLRVIRDTLPTGDYTFVGGTETLSIERKSLDDLAASLTRERDRFTREMQRLRAYPFRRLLVIGTREQIETHCYRSEVSPKSILSSLAAFEVRYCVPVCFAATPEAGAAIVEDWITWTAREQILTVNALCRAAEQSEIETVTE